MESSVSVTRDERRTLRMGECCLCIWSIFRGRSEMRAAQQALKRKYVPSSRVTLHLNRERGGGLSVNDRSAGVDPWVRDRHPRTLNVKVQTDAVKINHRDYLKHISTYFQTSRSKTLPNKRRLTSFSKIQKSRRQFKEIKNMCDYPFINY